MSILEVWLRSYFCFKDFPTDINSVSKSQDRTFIQSRARDDCIRDAGFVCYVIHQNARRLRPRYMFPKTVLCIRCSVLCGRVIEYRIGYMNSTTTYDRTHLRVYYALEKMYMLSQCSLSACTCTWWPKKNGMCTYARRNPNESSISPCALHVFVLSYRKQITLHIRMRTVVFLCWLVSVSIICCVRVVRVSYIHWW